MTIKNALFYDPQNTPFKKERCIKKVCEEQFSMFVEYMKLNSDLWISSA
jgi:hypothetical protein